MYKSFHVTETQPKTAPAVSKAAMEDPNAHFCWGDEGLLEAAIVPTRRNATTKAPRIMAAKTTRFGVEVYRLKQCRMITSHQVVLCAQIARAIKYAACLLARLKTNPQVVLLNLVRIYVEQALLLPENAVRCCSMYKDWR